MKPKPRFTSEQLKQFVSNYEKNPDRDIPEQFFATLDAYVGLINSLKHEEIGSRYPFITTDLISTLQQPFLSSEMPIADKLAEAFLNFIIEPPEQASQWAMQQLKKFLRQDTIAIPSFHLTKDNCIDSIIQFPEKYFEMQSDEILNTLSSLKLPSSLAQPLALEMLKRKLPINPMLINLIDLQKASPTLIIAAFDFFSDTPTIDFANSIMSFFLYHPPLHFSCVNKIVQNLSEKGKTSLEMLGTIFLQLIPFPYPLFYYYHPSVKPFIDEAEQMLLHPNDEIDNEAILQSLHLIGKKNLYYLIPLLLEFHGFTELIQSLSDEYFSIIFPYLKISS